jgi:cystathionine beta-lyase/cystathionine gamma-synthase
VADQDEHEGLGFETRAIHTGQPADAASGSVVTPITLSTTFAQRSVGEHQGFEYSRSGNPTRAALEACLASLEGAAHGFAFSSGLAAEDNVLRLLRPGDRILLGNDAYGGTFRLISKVYGAVGYPWSAADLTDVDALRDGWLPDTRMVWLETPTNPLLTCIDIEAVATLAHEKGALVVVDNTFATPYLQQPLALGADIVVHSTTKFLNGHSDSVGGVAVVRDKAHAEWLQYVQNAAGAILSPFDAWLVLRGTKTLALRMPRHEENGRRVAAFLREQKKIRRVYWPGFSDHPGHEIHKKQASGFGALISFDLGSREAADRLLRHVRLCSLGESLGGIETLISHPATMTHAGYTPAEREALGIGDGLVRISVGCEDAQDLIANVGEVQHRAAEVRPARP